MIKRIAIALAGALALGAGASRATDDKPPSSSGSGQTSTSSGQTSTSSGQTSTSSDTAASSNLPATTDTAGSQMSGDVKSTDSTAMVITIVLPSGGEQQLNVAKDAQITRDGDSASLSQIREGDSVRASLDPSTHQASRIQVKSKNAAPKSKDTSSDTSSSSGSSQSKDTTQPQK